MSLRIVATRPFAAGILGAAAAALGSYPSQAAQLPPANIVVIEGVSFRPDLLTVKRGDWVQWVNKDPFPHTVTAAGSFDSRSIAEGATWKYHASKVGTFAYACTLHPNMHGTLRVE
jgi:plastocyanin